VQQVLAQQVPHERRLLRAAAPAARLRTHGTKL
jgi:hypothetical protein